MYYIITLRFFQGHIHRQDVFCHDIGGVVDIQFVKEEGGLGFQCLTDSRETVEGFVGQGGRPVLDGAGAADQPAGGVHDVWPGAENRYYNFPFFRKLSYMIIYL
jgi:hypothetical protein